MKSRFLDVWRAGARGPWVAVPGAALLTMLLTAAPVAAVTLEVIGVDNIAGTTTTLAASDYRWLVEEDLTYHVPRDGSGNPLADPNTLAVGFHRSYMPVVAKGGAGSATPAFNFTPVAGHNYYVSVLPNTGYSIGGAQLSQDPVTGAFPATLRVYVNKHPIPTAQIAVQVCADTYPINNVCDPTEFGLADFAIVLEDGGGRYGMSAGTQSTDAFGNPLGTEYAFLDNCTLPSCTPGVQDPGEPYLLDIDGQPQITALGTGIHTDADGWALIKHLAPGKYGIIVVPPPGSGWVQTSTIEGTKIVDAWVKSNEPRYFAEFGPPGPHVFMSFVQEMNLLDTLPDPPVATLRGQVVNNHLSRSPDFAMYAGAPFPHTNCWIGLNEGAGGVGRGLFAAPCQEDGLFEIPDVPAGSYQLVVWDDNLDLVFLFRGVTVDPAGTCFNGGSCDLGLVPANQWFHRQEHWVFNDDGGGDGLCLTCAGDGMRRCVTEACDNWAAGDEVGIPEQAVNLRWRDGTMYQSMPTDLYGFVPFDQTFPFFSWLVAEVDFARFKATGATFWVDNGGPTDPLVLGGHTTPQDQTNPLCTLADPACTDIETSTYRVEQGVVLTAAFQGFLGQTNVVEWGKQAYVPGEHGGISGVVYYSVTRAEDDPRYGAAEPWEPGIPNVTVNLYDSTGSVWLNSVTTDSWDDSIPTGCKWGNGAAGPFMFDHDRDPGTALVETDCYDGLRNFNQIRPGVFDGGYAFDEVCSGGLAPDGSCAGGYVPITAGRYVVEALPPTGYEIVRSQDKNVDFGDVFYPSSQLLPPECVGTTYTVPTYLSLNTNLAGVPLPGVPADELVEANLAGETLNHCDRKLVNLYDGSNAAADFFLFTEVPIAAHSIGFILDDTQNEFDPNSPQFGEKYAPPFLPVGIRDWTGREIGRTLSDAFGRYNFLTPSTWSANLPQPSGMSPNMLTACMNARMKPVVGAGGAITYVSDPQHNPQYSQFCYTFQYMPGATVYLDTPVVPVAAFAGVNQYPLDCEYIDQTPRIFSVFNQSAQGSVPAQSGPYLTTSGTAATRKIAINSVGTVQVANPAYPGYGTNKTVARDFGFGTQGANSAVTLTNAAGTVTNLTIDSWSDSQIVATVPTLTSGPYQLDVRRHDSGRKTITGVTLQIGLRNGAVARRVPAQYSTIQAAIEAANLNDLILVAPGVYQEMLIMWKPVQLQGWGEGTIIDAVKAPPEALQAWRDNVATLFSNGSVTAVPGQELGFGGPEPAAFFTEEGAGVFVLPRAGQFGSNRNRGARIDGFLISGADTGGGIVVNGYAQYLEISNNRIINNNGFYGGGVRLGHPELVALDNQGNQYYPDAGNYNISIDHNHVTQNGGIAGAGGGVSICPGSDRYKLTDNYICGNFNQEKGGGVAHFGVSNDGLIANNKILFNESFFQQTTVNGGGVLIAGQPPFGCPVDPITGLPDPACLADPEQSLSPGTGNVTIDANLIQGNAAGAGDGGGIALRQVNGQDVASKPNSQGQWHRVRITNNMIFNNVAALAGGGISLQDTAYVNMFHNTILHNDSAATAGEAFAPGSPTASTPQDGAGVVSRRHSADLLRFYNVARFGDFSDPKMEDNIVWENRQFLFAGVGATPLPGSDPAAFGLCPAVGGDPTLYCTTDNGVPTAFQTDQNIFTDLAVLGSSNPAAALTCLNCLFTGTDPMVAAAYFNGGREPSLDQAEAFIQTPAAFDEGGNFIRVRFGPLSRLVCDTGIDPTTATCTGSWVLAGDAHVTAGSPAIDAGVNIDPTWDYDVQLRPDPTSGLPDIGADEYYAGTPPVPMTEQPGGSPDSTTAADESAE